VTGKVKQRQMKRMKYIYNFWLVIFTGYMLASCVGETIIAEREGNGAINGKGLISIAFSADKSVQTKADPPNGGDPNSGIDYEDEVNTFLRFEEEDRIKDIRVILYDTDGKAKYVRDYDITVANQWVEKTYPLYQTKAFEVDLRPYQVAILVNYKNEWKYYSADRDNEATNIDERTREVGHDLNVLTDTPLDFSKNADADNYKAKTFLMQTLTGVYDTPAWYIDQAIWKEDACFFMSNADGLIDVETSDIKNSTSAAETTPIKVNVERAIAKVAFFMDDELSDNISENLQPSGINAELKGFWRVDAHNMKVYPIRKQTQTVNGNQEAVGSDPANRYAEDPNFDIQPAGDFFRIPGSIEDPAYQDISQSSQNTTYIGNPLMKAKENIRTNGYIDPKNIPANYAYLEYVAENTMEDGEYNTGTTSNILLELKLDCKFLKNTGREEVSYSNYYRYKGKTYPPDWMEEWLNNRPLPEYYYISDEAITSTELDTDLASYKDEIKSHFSNNTPGELNGLRYYVGGVNYYRLPIRHFTDEQIAGGIYNTYGKYGVVRNNTYILKLEAITSLGNPVIPVSAPIVKSGNRVESGFDTEALTITTTIHK